MLAFDQADPLQRALDELSALGGDQDRESIEGVRGRLAEQRPRVLVAGEAKRGESTLVNALLGRADLQYRLAEATRRLTRAIDARYQEGTGRLEKALTAAGDRRSATADEVAAHDRELAGRLAAIDQALALLDSAAAPGARRIAS